MKKIKTLLLAVASLTVISGASQAQLVTHSAGDLIVAFYATGGTGASSITYVSLNAATTYRDATSSIYNITNVGSILNSTYGNGTWSDRTNLYWGVVGIRQPSAGAAIDGDPSRTVYMSQARPSVGTASSPIAGFTAANIGSLALNVGAIQTTFAAGTAASNANASVVATSEINTIDEFVPPTLDPAFSLLPTTPMQAFASGSFGNFGGSIGAVEGALDITRMLRNASGLSTGTTIGTITVDNTGAISFVAVPEPSTFALIGLGIAGFAISRRLRKNKVS